MRYVKLGLIPFFILTFILVQSLFFREGDAESDQPILLPADPILLTVTPTPSLALTQRIGLNLSAWSNYGAEQYMKNILVNPGFNGLIDRMLVIVSRIDEQSFSAGKGTGMPDSYFNRATYEVRTGHSAGASGTILQSYNVGADDLPQYLTDGPMPSLELNDVIVITQHSEPNPVGRWHVPSDSSSLVSFDNSSPHSSESLFSVVLAPSREKPAQIQYLADTITKRAGKLLLIQGPWRLSFWVRSEGPDSLLDIKFARLNEGSTFIEKTIHPSDAWQKVELSFNGDDQGSPASLELSFTATKSGTRVFIEEPFLASVQNHNPNSVWRQEVIDLLRELKPSWLRDWQGQTGDTFTNRIADLYQRETYHYRGANGEGEVNFSYSISEFLELCKEVHANPWLIVPTTLTDSELIEFGKYLAHQVNESHFAEVILEFANENGNSQAHLEKIPPVAYASMADRAFEHIAAAAGTDVQLRRIITGPYNNPDLAFQSATLTKQYDSFAIAPYFFDEVSPSSPQLEQIENLFKSQTSQLKLIHEHLMTLNKTLAVYEVNLNTVKGQGTASVRKPLVAGAISGTALGKVLIENLYFDASPQMVYCFSKFDTPLVNADGYVPLWGITRDLSPTRRFRPTGLAVKMLNDVLGGSLHALHLTTKTPESAEVSYSKHLTMAGFRTIDKWSTAIASTHSQPLDIEIEFPDDGRTLPSYGEVIESQSPFDTNEIREDVKIVRKDIKVKDRKVSVTIPAYGFLILKSELPGALPSTEPNALSSR
jgi:hypothetical protein